MTPPPFAGGAPVVLPPLQPHSLARHGVVTTAKLTTTLSPPYSPPLQQLRRRQSTEAEGAGGDAAAKARVERLVEDIDATATCAATENGGDAPPPSSWGGYALHLACLTAGVRGESPPALLIRSVTLPSSPSGDDDELSALPRERLPPPSQHADLQVLAEYPGASTILSAGGSDFWVVSQSISGAGSSSRGGSGRCIAYRWSTAHQQAVARVDLGTAAAAADAAVQVAHKGTEGRREVSGGGDVQGAKYPESGRFRGSSGELDSGGGLGRLAVSLHFPSNELIALTDRGNVLTVSPPLEACPLGKEDEGDDNGSSGVPYGQTVSHDDILPDNRGAGDGGMMPPSVRHVGCLLGFADEFGPSKHWHLSGLAAHGPFLWLVWFHRRVGKNSLSMIGSDLGKHLPKHHSVRGEPSTPPGKSAVSFYHITTGRSLGVAPLPSLPPLRDSLMGGGGGGSGSEGGVVKVIDGAKAGVFVLAQDDTSASALFQLVVHVPTSIATAVTPLLDLQGVMGGSGAGGVGAGENDGGDRDINSNGRGDGDGNVWSDADGTITARGGGLAGGAVAMRERAEMLRVMLQECVVWGGSLERLEGALALALTELETTAAAAGISLFAPALLLRNRPPPATEAEVTWQAAANQVADFYAAVYPPPGPYNQNHPHQHQHQHQQRQGPSEREARNAFRVYSQLAASEADVVVRAMTGEPPEETTVESAMRGGHLIRGVGGGGGGCGRSNGGDLVWDEGEINRTSAVGVQTLSERLRAAVAGVAVIESAAVTAVSILSSLPTPSAVEAAGQQIVRRLVDAVWSAGCVVLAPEESTQRSMDGQTCGGAGIVGVDVLEDIERAASGAAAETKGSRNMSAMGEGRSPMQAALDLLVRALSAAEAAHTSLGHLDGVEDCIGGHDTALDLPPFEALCMCLHESWPRALPLFIWRVAAAAAATEGGCIVGKESAGAAAEGLQTFTEMGANALAAKKMRRLLARRALQVLTLPPRGAGTVAANKPGGRGSGGERKRGETLVVWAVLLSTAGHHQAAAWLLLTKAGAATEDAGPSLPTAQHVAAAAAAAIDAEATLSFENDVDAYGAPSISGGTGETDEEVNPPVRTTAEGWSLATRLLKVEAAEGGGDGFHAAADVFEVLSAAFQQVVQRRLNVSVAADLIEGSTPRADGGVGADADVDSNAAAQHLLHAAEVLATVMSRHVTGTGGAHVGGMVNVKVNAKGGSEEGSRACAGGALSASAALVEDVAAGFTSTVARLGNLSLCDGDGDGDGDGTTTSQSHTPATLRVDSLEYLAASSTRCLAHLTRLIETK